MVQCKTEPTAYPSPDPSNVSLQIPPPGALPHLSKRSFEELLDAHISSSQVFEDLRFYPSKEKYNYTTFSRTVRIKTNIPTRTHPILPNLYQSRSQM